MRRRFTPSWKLAIVALLLPWALAAGATSPAPGFDHRPHPPAPSPEERGPYAAGYAHYTIFDGSRPGDRPGDATFRDTGRPIAFSVWFPVEPRAAHRADPATYHLDPYYGALDPVSSLDFEAQGLDPAYEGASLRPAHGAWPVVVLSPGAIFPDLGHVSLGTRLASHGFVVVVPYHFGMQWWSWEPEVDNLAVLAWDRPRDMSFILDDLERRNAREGDLFHRHLRTDLAVAGGWSIGGYGALVLAGGDDSVCDTFYGAWYSDPPAWTCAATPPDPRFQALLLLGASSSFLHFPELRRIRLPALALGESWDELLAVGGPAFASSQARQHLALQGHPSYRVDVNGAVHYSFGDECEYAAIMKQKGVTPAQGEALWSWDEILALDCGPGVIPAPTMRRLVNGYAVAFLRTHLLHQPGARYLLTPRWALEHAPDVEFFTRERCPPPLPTPDWPPDWVYFQHQPLPGAEDGEPCPEADTP